jgi:hypothetical protein
MADRRRRTVAATTVLVCLPVLSGCGGDPSVTGRVTYQSRPLASGQISFIAGDGRSASGTINSDGTYFVARVPAGRVVVVVTSLVPGRGPIPSPVLVKGARRTAVESAIPVRYGDPRTSGLTCFIGRDAQTIEIELPADH